MGERKSYQVAVIGSGAGGKKAAILAARNGLRVVLIEKDALGGTTFDRGYYSVRTFQACAEVAKEDSHWPDWFSARDQVRAWLTQNLKNRLDEAGVEVRFGRGSLANGNTTRLEKASGEPELIGAEYIILARFSTGVRWPKYRTEFREQRSIVRSDGMAKEAVDCRGRLPRL